MFISLAVFLLLYHITVEITIEKRDIIEINIILYSQVSLIQDLVTDFR